MAHTLYSCKCSLNGDVNEEPLCWVITSGSIIALQGLICGDGSANSLADVDSVGDNIPKHGYEPESEDKMDEVGEPQE